MKRRQGAQNSAIIAHSGAPGHERVDDRLEGSLRVAKNMRPFVERMRLRVSNISISATQRRHYNLSATGRR